MLAGNSLFIALAVDWNANGDNWIETDEETFDEQLGAVPPTAISNLGFLVGEPWRHENQKGQEIPIFAAFISANKRFYAKYMDYAEFRGLSREIMSRKVLDTDQA